MLSLEERLNAKAKQYYYDLGSKALVNNIWKEIVKIFDSTTPSDYDESYGYMVTIHHNENGAYYTTSWQNGEETQVPFNIWAFWYCEKKIKEKAESEGIEFHTSIDKSRVDFIFKYKG